MGLIEIKAPLKYSFWRSCLNNFTLCFRLVLSYNIHEKLFNVVLVIILQDLNCICTSVLIEKVQSKFRKIFKCKDVNVRTMFILASFCMQTRFQTLKTTI